MAPQLLFYNDVVPLNKERHQGWSLKQVDDYSFADKANSVPLMSVEFFQASADYPIVFAGDEEVVSPVLLLGLQQAQNLFLQSNGSWSGGYIPAFIRRYPFVFTRSDDGEQYYLCIDESHPGFNQYGEGEALLNEDGNPTDFTDNILKFLSSYQYEFQRTQAFCKKLKELNLLEAKQADISLPDGTKKSLKGFYTVERQRLASLSSESIVELVRSGYYEMICSHLASLRNFKLLSDLSNERVSESGELHAVV